MQLEANRNAAMEKNNIHPPESDLISLYELN